MRGEVVKGKPKNYFWFIMAIVGVETGTASSSEVISVQYKIKHFYLILRKRKPSPHNQHPVLALNQHICVERT